MSAGIRSRRVDSIWPNLTKIGPSVSSARRNRTARGSESRRQNNKALTGARNARTRYAETAKLLSVEPEVLGERFNPVEQRDLALYEQILEAA